MALTNMVEIMNDDEHRKKLISDLHSYLDQLGELATRLGFARASGQVLGALFLTDAETPLSATDLTAMLDISRSTLQLALTELLNSGLATTARVRGSRKDHYKTYSDGWELVMHVLRAMRRRDLTPAMLTMGSTLSILNRTKERDMADRLKTLIEALGGIDEAIGRLNGSGTEKFKRSITRCFA